MKTDKSDTLKEAMKEALEKTLGVVKPACERVGISRDTHYRWLKEDEEYAKAIRYAKEDRLDLSESKLFKAIINDDMRAVFWHLEREGKSRGWVQRQEITGAEGNKLDVSIEVVKNADRPSD